MEFEEYVSLHTSPKKPQNTQLFIESNASGTLYIVDSVDNTKIYKSVDKGATWSQLDVDPGNASGDAKSRLKKVISVWTDWDNDEFWFLDCDNDGTPFYVWKIDITDDSVTEILSQSCTNMYDIFKIGSNFYTAGFRSVEGFKVWLVDSSPAVLKDSAAMSDSLGPLGIGVVVGANYYTSQEWQNGVGMFIFEQSPANITEGDLFNPLLYELPPINLRGCAYDGSNVIYYTAEDQSGVNTHLFSYDINADDTVKQSVYKVALMTDRLSATTAQEKAFHISEYKIYQIHLENHQLHLISQPSSDAVFIAISDTFLMNNDGDMWEWNDDISNIQSVLIDHKIMEAPVSKIKLKKDVYSISKGMLITIRDSYTSQSDSNTATIFEGKVVDFDDKLLQTIWLESPALKELDNIFPEGTYSGSSQSIINSLITTYCNYITVGTLVAGIAMGSITYEGDKSLRNILLTLIYINNFIWALTPTGVFNFNSGAIDSGVDLTETDAVWKVRTGNQGEGMNYWKIRGAIVGGSQLEKVLQDPDDQVLNGLNPLSETYAELNTQSLVNIMANARKLRTQNTSKIVNYKHYDLTLGFIQPGETKTFEYGLSEPVVAQDQFIIYGVKYHARQGIGDYKIADELV